MKIIVFGATGMAGHVITDYLRSSGHDVLPIGGRRPLDEGGVHFDVTNQAQLLEFIAANGDADVIINSVGILVQDSEDHPDLAAYANSYFPHLLERLTRGTSTKVIHLSTDCVFAGTKAPYREDDDYDGTSFYDRSKALGELKNNKDLTFRMSIIGPDLSPSGIGLFNWFMGESGTIKGFTNAMWNGITTVELARAIDAALMHNVTGLYHLVPDKNISKFDLLILLKDQFARTDLIIERDNRAAPDKTLKNTRPDFDFAVRSYPQQIQDMYHWISIRERQYPHYKM